MSEFIFKTARSKIVQIVLYSVLVVSFAFVGIEAYVRNPSGLDTIAEVGRERVTSAEYDEAVRAQQDRLRGILGQNYDPKIFDTREARQQILDEVLNRKLIMVAADKAGARVSDVALAEQIAKEAAFQENGVFSSEKYRNLLKSINRSQKSFEENTRKDMERTLFVDALTRTGIASSVSAELYAKAMDQSREISVVILQPDAYSAQVKVDEAQAKTYYEQKKSEFTIPEQVRAEYVELSLDGLSGAESVTEAEVKAAYDAGYAAKYAEKQAARKKAEEVLAKVRKEPRKFADFAKDYSQDTGSAANGGSLGAFGKGAMVKPFEEAVFSKLKVDQISDLVETEFGFHIIQLTGIKPAKDGAGEQREARHILFKAPIDGKPFETAKAEIERNLRRERAGKKFAEAAARFGDRVFEQSSSLKPVAEEFKLAIRQTPYMAKGVGFPPFNNPKLSQALFSDEVLRNKRNTEVIEIAPNVLVAARVLESKAAEVRPFESVKADILRRLQREEAVKLAVADGEKKIADLKAGKDAGLNWPAPLAVSRQKTASLSPQIIEQVLKANVSKLPTYVGVKDAQGGYALVQVSKVIDAPAPDASALGGMRQRAEQALLQEELNALLAQTRAATGVKVRANALEPRQPQP